MERQKAIHAATRFKSRIQASCERVVVAGSIRRKKPEVKDIEIVAESKLLTDLFGEKTLPMIDHALELVLQSPNYRRGDKWGDRYKRIYLPKEDVFIDLFIVFPPAQWGVIYAIRTGPANFSQWLVTPKNKGGALPDGFLVSAGQLWKMDYSTKTELHARLIETPTEQSFFEAIGLDYLEPEDRQPNWSKYAEETLE